MAVQFSSSYIISRCPYRFGNQQNNYLVKSEEAISSAIRQIKEGNSGDLQKLFFFILDDLGQRRKAIAVDHKHRNSSKEFGHRRDAERGLGPYSSPLTGLFGFYKDYNTLILNRFHEEIQHMSHDLKEFKEKERVLNDTFLGRKSSFKFQILERHERPEYVPNAQISARISGSSNLTQADIYDSKSRMQAFKEKAPKLYAQDKLWTAINELKRNHPSPQRADLSNGQLDYIGDTANLKSLYLYGTSRLEIDGKMYALSNYLTWLYCTCDTDPVERMKECSIVWVLHHDTFLIEKTLNDASKVFEQAVRWNQNDESVRSLKERVGLLRYEFAHIMPFLRGSASIGEWLETALYRYHGFLSMHHNCDKMGDLEALTALTLRQFMDCYDSTIVLGERTAQ